MTSTGSGSAQSPSLNPDWSAAQDKASRHFTVREALFLPSWGRMAVEQDFPGLPDWPTVLANLQPFLAKMDTVRDWFGAPIRVHVTVRPPAYNLRIGGAYSSAHIYGMACDFDVQGIECGNAIESILQNGMLDTWGLRMEDNGPLPSWIHLDAREPGPTGRYFKP